MTTTTGSTARLLRDVTINGVVFARGLPFTVISEVLSDGMSDGTVFYRVDVPGSDRNWFAVKDVELLAPLGAPAPRSTDGTTGRLIKVVRAGKQFFGINTTFTIIGELITDSVDRPPFYDVQIPGSDHCWFLAADVELFVDGPSVPVTRTYQVKTKVSFEQVDEVVAYSAEEATWKRSRRTMPTLDGWKLRALSVSLDA